MTRSSSSKTKQKSAPGKKDQDQWVILAPDSCFGNVEDDSQSAHFVKLRHPLSNSGALFLFSNKSVQEVSKFDEKYRSWFIGETVQKDGSLYLLTPVDALFLILPYLVKQSGKFMALDQIIIDDEFQECMRLVHYAEKMDLSPVCDIKDVADMKFYQYSKEKTFLWLKKKIERVAKSLEEKNIYVGTGSQADTFIRNKKEKGSHDDYMRYSHGLVSDYLDESMSKTLKEYLGIKDPVIQQRLKSETDEPPKKKARLSAEGPSEDYSNAIPKAETKKGPKLTAAQKKLKSADKTGMKSIASFFGAPKK